MNEKLRVVNAAFARSTDTFEVICECGHTTCEERLSIPPEAYEHVRADPLLFVIVRGHEIPDVEDVVLEAESHSVVRKHPGDPAQVAVTTDPRS